MAPWTAFKHKYRLLRWPWREMLRLQRRLEALRFLPVGALGPAGPRALLLAQARRRLIRALGKPNDPERGPARPDPTEHRYEHWRVMARQLGIEVPPRAPAAPVEPGRRDSRAYRGRPAGARLAAGTLPHAIARLRRNHHSVQIACDPDQREWWVKAGETNVAAPRTVTELFALVDRAGARIGNDRPGHLAAFCGVPTSPPCLARKWLNGSPPSTPPRSGWKARRVPTNPLDYCRSLTPHCMFNTQGTKWARGSRRLWRGCCGAGEAARRRRYPGSERTAAAGTAVAAAFLACLRMHGGGQMAREEVLN